MLLRVVGLRVRGADASHARPRARARWEANSYGYHGDDGRKFAATPRGDAYGPTFTTGAPCPNNQRAAPQPRSAHPQPRSAARHAGADAPALPRRAGDVVGAGIVLSRGDVFFTCVALFPPISGRSHSI